MNEETIGIIGLGFVGGAIKAAYEFTKPFINVVCIDPAKGYLNTYKDIKDSSGVFVCVPSPMRDDGTCDTSALIDVLENLKAINYQGVIISKVTAPPAVYFELQEAFPNLVHAPEFLTAANAERDYASGTFSIIGGAVSAYINEAERIIKIGQSRVTSVAKCTIQEAALSKYVINSFLATKVAFMNEIYQLAQASNCNYSKVSHMVALDERIGSSHMRVPGPDGSFGFGGACFPKDTAALLKYAESIGVSLNILDSAVKKNTLLRLTEPK